MLFEGVVDVEEREMIALRMRETGFGTISGLLGVFGTDKNILNAEHGGDTEDFVGGPMSRRGDDHLAELRIERKFRHLSANGRDLPFIIEGAEIVEEFEGSHHRLWGGRIHKVKVDQIIDSELFELQNNTRQVAA